MCPGAAEQRAALNCQNKREEAEENGCYAALWTQKNRLSDTKAQLSRTLCLCVCVCVCVCVFVHVCEMCDSHLLPVQMVGTFSAVANVMHLMELQLKRQTINMNHIKRY